MKNLNKWIDKICISISDLLGTNFCIFIFILIAFVPLYYQTPTTISAWQNWLSQTCIQLVALAVLQKGTKIEGNRTYNMQKETHDTVMNEFSEIKEMHEFLLKEIKETKIYCKGCKN